MSSGPYYYPAYNAYNSAIQPSTVHVRNTGLARFFKRYLLEEAISVFDWTIPETWDRTYFLYVLYVWGYIAVIETDKYGVIPQHAGLGGYTVQYAPAYTIVTNPLFRETYQLTIGKECAVIKLEPDWCGLYDIVDYYGDLMALCAEATGVNLLNSKMSFAFASSSKASAESLKKLYDQYASGEPAVFFDKDLLDERGKLTMEMFVQDVGQNFLADKLLDTMRSIRCMFLTDIGIPNTNLYKASGISAEEVTANNLETRSKCALWMDELKRGCKMVREMYGVNLDVNWRSDLMPVQPEGGDQDEDLA